MTHSGVRGMLRQAAGKSLIVLGAGSIAAVLIHTALLKWGLMLHGFMGIMDLFMRVLVPSALLLFPGVALLRMKTSTTFRRAYADVFRSYTWLPIATILAFASILALAPPLDRKGTHFGAIPEVIGWGAVVLAFYVIVSAVLKPYKLLPRWLAAGILVLLVIAAGAYFFFGIIIWSPLVGN